MNIALRTWMCTAACMTACCVVPEPVAPDIDSTTDVCQAACDRRHALHCIEPQLEPQCRTVCVKASALGLYNPLKVATASRAEMLGLGVRCDR